MPIVRIVYVSRESCFKLRWKENGKTRERKSTARNRRLAEREAAILENELESANHSKESANHSKESARRTVIWDELKLRYATEYCSPGPRVSWRSACKWIEKVAEIKSTADITASVISRAIANMEAAGLARATVRGYLQHFMAGLRWAKEMDLIESVPNVRLPKPGGRKMRSRPITAVEYDQLVGLANSSDRSHLVPVLEFCYWGGLRIGEVTKLTADPLGDFVVTLDEPPRFIIQAHAQKSRKDQQALVAPELVAILRERWSELPKVGRLLPNVSASPHWLSLTVAQLGRDSGIVVKILGRR